MTLRLAVEHVLKGPARQHKGLRRHLAHFTRDLLAVLVGLRAAVMLDYMVIPSELTLGIIQRLNTTCAGSDLCAAQLDGCQYVYSASMLAERAATLSGGSQSGGGAHPPLFLMLKGGLVAVCPPEELQTVQTQLSRLCCALGTHGHRPEAGEQAAGWPPEVVDLSQCTDLPIMPTLSGWLLEYATVYLASSEDAAALAAALSQQALVLCSVDCQMKGSQVQPASAGLLRLGGKQTWCKSRFNCVQAPLSPLMSFSAPSTFQADALPHVNAFVADMKVRAAQQDDFENVSVNWKMLGVCSVQL